MKYEQISMIDGVKPYKQPSGREKKLRSFCDKFQKWSDKQAQDESTADGKCGYMRCCNYCRSSSEKTPCAKAMRAYLRKEKINIDLSKPFNEIMEKLDY